MDVSQGSPIDQINFSQLKAKLNGVIHCIGKHFLIGTAWKFLFRIDDCPNDIPMLELRSRSGVVQKLDLVKNPSKTNEIHFEQDNLLPGKYSVSLVKNKQNEKFCWKESQIEVDLSNSNRTIKFEQIGFKLRLHLDTSNKVLLVNCFPLLKGLLRSICFS